MNRSTTHVVVPFGTMRGSARLVYPDRPRHEKKNVNLHDKVEKRDGRVIKAGTGGTIHSKVA